MPAWAPVVAADAYSGDEESVEIQDGVVLTKCAGSLISRLDPKIKHVSHAVRAVFQGQPYIVVVARGIICSYGPQGLSTMTELPFVADSALACEKGLFLASGGSFYLFSHPLRLLGTIVPSSTSMVAKNARPIFFGSKQTQLALFQEENAVGIYSIRYLTSSRIKKPSANLSSASSSTDNSFLKRLPSRPSRDRISSLDRTSARMHRASDRQSARKSGRISDRLSLPRSLHDESFAFETSNLGLEDIEYEKQAVIHALDQIKLPQGAKITKALDQAFQRQRVLYFFDETHQLLHAVIYGRGNELEKHLTKECLDIAAIDGFKAGDDVYPYVAVINKDHSMELYSAFFPHCSLNVPVAGHAPDKLVTSSKNSIVYETADTSRHRLAITDTLSDSLVSECMRLVSHTHEPSAVAFWIRASLIAAAAYPTLTAFEAFKAATICCYANLDSIDAESNAVPEPFSTSDKQSQPSVYVADKSSGKPREWAARPPPRQIRAESPAWIQAAKLAQAMGGTLNSSAENLIIYLHLLREEKHLDAHGARDAHELGRLLACLTTWAGWEWRTQYAVDASAEEINASITIYAPQVGGRVPNIYESLLSTFYDPTIPYPQIAYPSAPEGIFWRSQCLLTVFDLAGRVQSADAVVEAFVQFGLTSAKITAIALVPRLCLLEQIWVLQKNAVDTKFDFIGRRDLALTADPVAAQELPHSKPDRLEVARMRFGQDRRYYEVARLLQTTKVQHCSLVQPAGCTEHEWLRMQKELAEATGLRTMTTGYGRAAQEFCSHTPTISERATLPALEFDLVIRNQNTNIAFKQSELSEKYRTWGNFAQGLAGALAIDRKVEMSSNRIMSHLPHSGTTKELDPAALAQNSGFLLGLGLNGHLANMEEWHVYNLLGPKSPLMTAALLIGLSASKLGTMDVKLTKVLSVHMPVLLPPGASNLNVSVMMQTAAALSIGLVYVGSQHRRMTEVMLHELLSPDVLHQEHYRTICGAALGLINVGKGSDLRGLADLPVVETLQKLVAIRLDAAPPTPLDHSHDGATMALMLTFLGSNDASIAASLESPASEFLTDYIRPDLLYTRAMARQLVLFDGIGTSREWVQAQLPEQMRMDLGQCKHINTDHLPFVYTLGGILVAMSLKNASTNNQEVLDTLLWYLDEFRRLTAPTPHNIDARMARVGYASVQAFVVIGAAIVAAGHGEVRVLQRLRPLFARTWSNTGFGDFMSVSLGMGLLFLGGGQYALDTSLRSIGLMAVGLQTLSSSPPTSWQFLRFFWTLAAVPRALLVRHADTGALVSVEVDITSDDGSRQEQAPCLLPPLSSLQSLTISDPRFLPLRVVLDDSPLATGFAKTQTLFVQTDAYTRAATLADLLAHEPLPNASLYDQIAALARPPLKRPEQLWALKLLFVFARFWKLRHELHWIPLTAVEDAKQQVWQEKERQKTSYTPSRGVF